MCSWKRVYMFKVYYWQGFLRHHTQKLNVLEKSIRRKKVVGVILMKLEIATVTQYFLGLWQGSRKKSVKDYR